MGAGARRTYWYVAASRERAGYPAEGWVPADGPFSAACSDTPRTREPTSSETAGTRASRRAHLPRGPEAHDAADGAAGRATLSRRKTDNQGRGSAAESTMVRARKLELEPSRCGDRAPRHDVAEEMRTQETYYVRYHSPCPLTRAVPSALPRPGTLPNRACPLAQNALL